MTEIKHYPPGHKPVKNIFALIKLMRRFRSDLLGVFNQDFKHFGDIFSIDVLGQRQYMIQHPEYIYEVIVKQASKFHKDSQYKDPKKGLAFFLGNGLLTSDGDFWKRQRKLMAPAFHTRRISGYGQIMVDQALAIAESWRNKPEVDVDQAMMHVTLQIVARALSSNGLPDADASRIGEAVTTLQHTGELLDELLPTWVPLPIRQRAAQAVRDLDEIVYRLIAERRSSIADGTGADTGDLLWMLLDARDDDGNGMTDKQIRDEIVTLFLAGHETTANTLNWTWVLLSQNPDKEAKLHEELDRVLNGRLPTLEDLRNLPYTALVIKESMRVYPPIFVVGRVATEDLQIGGVDVPRYDIDKGTIFAVYINGAHNDPRWFPNAEKFEPERWTPEFEATLPKMAYAPFIAGPRVCIGNSFAQMEAQLLLATLASRYRLRLMGDAPVPEPLITLRPKGGLHMRIEPRTPQSQPVDAVEVDEAQEAPVAL